MTGRVAKLTGIAPLTVIGADCLMTLNCKAPAVRHLEQSWHPGKKDGDGTVRPLPLLDLGCLHNCTVLSFDMVYEILYTTMQPSQAAHLPNRPHEKLCSFTQHMQGSQHTRHLPRHCQGDNGIPA